MRQHSQQANRLHSLARNRGIAPRIDEHQAIVDALKSGDAQAAKAAMRTHLRQVAVAVFDATEAEAIEDAKARVAGQRANFISRF
jgi:DNA-binding GntR family transcriptional regulator